MYAEARSNDHLINQNRLGQEQIVVERESVMNENGSDRFVVGKTQHDHVQ